VIPKSETEAVTQYKPFVLKTVQRFAASGVANEDLVQEGLLAVAIAFRTWREDGGANFLTWIRRPVYYAMLKLVREQKKGGGSFKGGGPGAIKGEKNSVRFVSLDGPAIDVIPAHLGNEYNENRLELHEKIGTFEEPADPFVHGKLPNLVSSLDARERQVLRLRFEKGLAYTEVGAKLKISRERVRQIEQKALARLRELMTNGEERES
jgi:RNA polymerase sigma factor (sigma-70 family)